MTVASVPSIFYEFAFNTDPNQATIPPYWSDLSSRVQYGWTLSRGRQYELDTDEAGEWQVELANPDGALDPGNTASPYAPILLYRPCRIRMVLGNNLLSPDAASAGEWSPLPAGPAPAWAGVTAFVNAIAHIAQVGASAYQGSRVWTTTVPSGTAGADLLDVAVTQVTAGTTYTFTTQAQAVTSGQNPAVLAAIGWIGANGQTLSTASGSPSTLTGAGGTWTQLTVTAAAPAGTVAALLRIVTTTTPSAASTIWTDGLQLEARGYPTRWQMPWTTGANLLPQNIATGTETMSVATDTPAAWFYPAVGTVAQALFLTAAPTGATTAAGWTFPTGSTTAAAALYAGVNAANPAGPVVDCTQVVAGQSHTASVYLMRAASADATVQATISVAWFSSAGVALSTSTGSAVTVSTSSWTRATVSATAPAGAAWGRVLIRLAAPATTTAQNTIYTTGWQLEQAAAVTVWADPGPATFLFTGLVERFPRTWNDMDGTYGTSQLECTDVTAALAQFPLLAPFVQELLLLGPNFLYQLDDPEGSTSCTDTTGKRVPAPVENSPYGVGSLTFGGSVTSTSPTAGFLGAPGPVATFNNNQGGGQLPATYIALHKTAAVPGPPNIGPWTRMIAFRAPPSVGGGTAWGSQSVTSAPGSFVVSASVSGLFVSHHDGAGTLLRYVGTTSMLDGNWHQVAITVDPTSGNGAIYLDGAQVATSTGMGSPGLMPVDAVGAYIVPPLALYGGGWVGDIAHVTEFPFAATPTQITGLYNSWRTASAGESSGARCARILGWIGWTGPTNIAAGSTQSMGPATDTTGQTPLDALNGVAATENGDFYIDAAGRPTFTARSALYGVRTPQVVFGEARPVGNAGEWPCEVGSIDYDPSHLANITQVTQYNGSVNTGTDTTSIRRYFSRLYQRTVNVTSANEAQDAATYLISQLKDPHQRADAISLHPSAIIGLFPVVARLDKGTRIRYIKRPVGAPSTVLDGYLQRIAWTWSADTNDVYVEYQASPADLESYWCAAALHTVLSAQAASGQNQVSINALPDAAYNLLAQSMPTSQVLWFEPGTARFEAVTVLTIPSTSLGYATATLTMAANLGFTHPAGSVVCEPLQTGIADPTTWDPSAILAATYAPILSGGGAGTNTVTVGPLPDVAYNALGQTWNTGDTVVLSSGGVGTVETATIASVTTTYPGYTSAVITFTANLANNHPAGDYVSDQLLVANSNPATLAATTRATYARTLPVLVLLLGTSGRLSERLASLAMPFAVVLLAVLGVGVAALAVRARRQRSASRPPLLGLLGVARRAPGHPARVSSPELRIGMPSRTCRAVRIALHKHAANVLATRYRLAVFRVAAPSVLAHDVIERQTVGYERDLAFVQKSVDVPRPPFEPDFGSLIGRVSTAPPPAGGGLVDVGVNLGERFHVPNSSCRSESTFEDGSLP